MRSSQKSNRQRGRGRGNKPNGNIVNRVFESAGPEGKVRGTPQQIIDKYLALARDAQTSGDRVAAENFHQHAEHYQRMLIAAQGSQQQERRDNQDDQPYGGSDGSDQESHSQPETGGGAASSGSSAPASSSGASAGSSSGMDMIEPQDSADGAGDVSPLVDTPENSDLRRGGSADAEGSETPSEERPKRRRRPRADKSSAQSGESGAAKQGEEGATAAE